jgi:hypothetical protein
MLEVRVVFVLGADHLEVGHDGVHAALDPSNSELGDAHRRVIVPGETRHDAMMRARLVDSSLGERLVEAIGEVDEIRRSRDGGGVHERQDRPVARHRQPLRGFSRFDVP